MAGKDVLIWATTNWSHWRWLSRVNALSPSGKLAHRIVASTPTSVSSIT